MARQRYARIIDAAKMYAAVDNYIKYITDSTKKGTKVGSGAPHKKSGIVYVTPFAIDLAEDQVVKQTAAAATISTFKGFSEVSSRFEEALGENTAIPLKDFKAARVVVVTGRSGQGTQKTSKVTGQKYLSYGGSSTSFPFGRKTGSVEEGTAFLAIKAQISGDAAYTNAVISHIEEKFAV